ncbi:MAG: hypothetical protein LUC93_00800, partial [Planctomycetaceae bacterium]|nr:hypothetical protein [Planctomycetaceae bacterium]
AMWPRMPPASTVVWIPAALEVVPATAELPLADLPLAEPGHADVAGAWVLGPDLVDGTRRWLWDRFEMSTAYGRLDDDGKKVSRLLGDMMAQLFTAYPRGQVRIRYDQPGDRCRFVGRVPHGTVRPPR